MPNPQAMHGSPDPGIGSTLEADIDDVLLRLGPIADRLASRAPVAQYEADILNPLAARAGTSLAGTIGPMPRFLPVRDVIRIAFNIEALTPPGTVPIRQERSARSPTDDNLATALPYAPTLLDALQLMARYGEAAVPWCGRSIVEQGSDLVISYWPLVPIGRIESLATEVAMGTIHRLVETFVGPRIGDARVILPKLPVTGLAAMQARFSCPVELGEGPSRMIVPADWGAVASPYFDSRLWQDGVARCEADIAALSDPPRVSRVRAHVLAMLDGGAVPSLAQTARALGLPTRSLVRALAAEGQTHHGIVDVERRHRALRLLARRDLAVADIADLLGFSDQSSFGRKCRAWFGESPTGVRRRLTSGTTCPA